MFTTKYFFVLLFTFVTPRPAEFDALIGPFRQIRLAAFKFINSTGRENLPILRARNKVQQVAKIAFPCPLNNTRSPQPPENVNKVRPGDIDVIAGLGDSITAGVGLMAVNLLQIFLEYRGIAATAGGEATWRKYLTLPNILKVFNPNLTGFATATTLTLNPESRFNVGESGAVSEDTPYMAKVMIKRMVEDPSIDIHKHWKMVTLMIGPNDFCSQICYKNNLTAILEEHRNDLLQVLRILKYNLPRTIVNVIPPPNLEILIGFTGVPPKCELSHLFECPCLFGPTSGNRQDIYIKLMKQWQKLDMEIVNSEEFDSDNFTVVLQPFTLDFFLPNTTEGVTDFSYLAEDCFHMSQKGNARIANALWNNIMEPVGQKSTRPVEIFEKFNCPSQERPYIFTRKNSVRSRKMVFRSCIYGFFVFYLCNGQKPDTFGNSTLRFPLMGSSVRRQPPIPPSFKFPCSTTMGRSPSRPTSVHRLRPGDIDVVGAMGDSLIAGNGALEEWALGTMIEYRGVSWCAGGQGTWREFLTLPNILKEFNPNLTGFSTGTGEFSSPRSQLNVAFPVSADADALTQAKVLVGRMRRNKRIDFERDWKMVTIFFGANDICSGQCYNKVEFSPRMHAKKLMVALDYLQRALPRAFVNLIPVLDVSVSVRIKRTMMCRFLHTLFCACFHRGGNEMDVITQMTREYQRAEEELIFSGRYDTKDDFTVVLQPFMKLFNAPDDKARRYDEVIDISYITYDCFHFSQKGHALGANMLWNNLLQPVGRKSTKRLNYIMESFECPKPEAPFLFTRKNSRTFLETGHQ